MSLSKLREKVKDREALYIRDKVEINAPAPHPRGLWLEFRKRTKENRIRKPSMC